MEVRLVAADAAGDFLEGECCSQIRTLIRRRGDKLGRENAGCRECGGGCEINLQEGIGGLWAVAYVRSECKTAKKLRERWR